MYRERRAASKLNSINKYHVSAFAAYRDSAAVAYPPPKSKQANSSHQDKAIPRRKQQAATGVTDPTVSPPYPRSLIQSQPPPLHLHCPNTESLARERVAHVHVHRYRGGHSRKNHPLRGRWAPE
ncbi:hypothetical protein K438DRAFT_1016259 [Mycena galopus ATCC 62051]|nr:hypothetical protein K438DRAFT_1016259 [Mycena galopus ATCC 62051]